MEPKRKRKENGLSTGTSEARGVHWAGWWRQRVVMLGRRWEPEATALGRGDAWVSGGAEERMVLGCSLWKGLNEGLASEK